MRVSTGKIAAFILTGLLIGNVNACTVNNSMYDSLREVVEKNGGFPVSDEQCAILNNNNLKLSIDGESTVLVGANVGWAVVHLADMKSNVTSNKFGASTQVSNGGVASQDVADQQFYKALTDALNELDWAGAVKQVAQYRKAAR